MTVYVDDMLLQATVPNGARSVTSRWSHLFTDLDDQTELHEFAAKLGLRRSWFQHEDMLSTHPWLCHYDVTERVRKKAIALGATEITYPGGTAQLIRRRLETRDREHGAQRGRLLDRVRQGRP